MNKKCNGLCMFCFPTGKLNVQTTSFSQDFTLTYCANAPPTLFAHKSLAGIKDASTANIK